MARAPVAVERATSPPEARVGPCGEALTRTLAGCVRARAARAVAHDGLLQRWPWPWPWDSSDETTIVRVGEAKRMPFADPWFSNPTQTGTQQMVPSGADLRQLRDAIARRPGWDRLTPSQAWALLAAEKKGEINAKDDLQRATARLHEFNAKFKTTYPTDADAAVGVLVRAGEHLASRLLATNYFLGAVPGRNIKRADQGGEHGPAPKTLAALLMEDPGGEFRTVWETRASQASTDLTTRGAVEEQFGYATAVGRTGGRYQDLHDKTSTFAPGERGEMPKYAGLVSAHQRLGVGPRYGSSVIYWKNTVRERVTHTAGDSWGNFGAGTYTSNKHPITLLAWGDETLVRLALAEATDFTFDESFRQNAEAGIAINAYFETQIHGRLTWHDVSHIVLNWGDFRDKEGNVIEGTSLADAKRLRDDLNRFAKTNNYDFLVRLGEERR